MGDAEQHKDSEYAYGSRIPGTQYEVERVLGKGAFGTVYGARHTYLHQPAAVKVLRANLMGLEFASRMTAEAVALAQIVHPNIVEVKDGGLTDEPQPRPYFVMPRLNGETLGEMLKKLPKGIGLQKSLELIPALLDALDHVHAHHIVHRDLKPPNIFLHVGAHARTIPKILDFGVIHFIGKSRFTGDRVIGTPRYMAPEQLRGEKPSPQTDLYAMGLLLYECVCGRGPFDHLRGKDRNSKVIHAHMFTEPPKPSSIKHDVPPELEAVIMHLLAKDPAKRPQSAASVAITLREMRIRHEDIHIRRPTINDTEPTPIDSLLVGYEEDRTEPDAACAPLEAPIVERMANETVRDRVPRPNQTQRLAVGDSTSIDRMAPTPTGAPRLVRIVAINQAVDATIEEEDIYRAPPPPERRPRPAAGAPPEPSAPSPTTGGANVSQSLVRGRRRLWHHDPRINALYGTIVTVGSLTILLMIGLIGHELAKLAHLRHAATSTMPAPSSSVFSGTVPSGTPSAR